MKRQTTQKILNFGKETAVTWFSSKKAYSVSVATFQIFNLQPLFSFLMRYDR